MAEDVVRRGWKHFVETNTGLGDDPDHPALLDMRLSFYAGAVLMQALCTTGHDPVSLRKEADALALETLVELQKLGRADDGAHPLQ